MSTTSEDNRKKRRYLLLLLLLLLGILIVIFFFVFRGNGDSSTSASGASTASAQAVAPAASDAITAPGIPALEAYANGTSIGWQVTASGDNGGSPYAGYEIELISETKDIHADFPGNGSGAGMYAWTFGGQPTVMARTYNEAGLTSEWAAMLLPVIDPGASDTLTTNASPKSVQKQPEPNASASNREKPQSLVGETPGTIVSLPLLPPVITGGIPALPLRPADIPKPSATPTEMPVTPVVPSAEGTTSASPSASPTSTPPSSPSATPSASPSRTHSEDDDEKKKEEEKKREEEKKKEQEKKREEEKKKEQESKKS
jgi:hypothetical protein